MKSNAIKKQPNNDRTIVGVASLRVAHFCIKRRIENTISNQVPGTSSSSAPLTWNRVID